MSKVRIKAVPGSTVYVVTSDVAGEPVMIGPVEVNRVEVMSDENVDYLVNLYMSNGVISISVDGDHVFDRQYQANSFLDEKLAELEQLANERAEEALALVDEELAKHDEKDGE